MLTGQVVDPRGDGSQLTYALNVFATLVPHLHLPAFAKAQSPALEPHLVPEVLVGLCWSEKDPCSP